MLTNIILFILVILIAESGTTKTPPFSIHYIFAFAGTITALQIFLAWLLNRYAMRNITRLSRAKFITKYIRIKICYWMLFLSIFYLLAHQFGWSYLIISRLCGIPIARELALALPFLVVLFSFWTFSYSLDRALRGALWRRLTYIKYNVRMLFVPLIPFFLFQVLYSLYENLPEDIRVCFEAYEFFQIALLVGFLIIIFMFAPFLIRLMFKSDPLKHGALRERLEEIMKRAGLKCRNILVLRTEGGKIANACISGITARFFYVFLSDHILANMKSKETEGVFGHELGHAKGRHLIYYLLLVVTFILTLVAFQYYLVLFFSDNNLIINLAIATFALFFWGGFFGFLSRRFERESDLFGSYVGGIVPFISALEKIGVMSGGMRKKFGFRHFSIEKRVEFLSYTQEDPSLIKRFRRQLISAKICLWAMLLVSIVFVLPIIRQDIIFGNTERMFYKKEFKKAASYLKKRHDSIMDKFSYYIAMEKVQMKLNRIDLAESYLKKAQDLRKHSKYIKKRLRKIRRLKSIK